MVTSTVALPSKDSLLKCVNNPVVEKCQSCCAEDLKIHDCLRNEARERRIIGKTFRNDLVEATGQPCISPGRAWQATGSESCMGSGDGTCEA